MATATEPIPTPETLAIHADAQWIRDAQGRVVFLRGANYSGLEFGNFIGLAHGPEESDFAQMESWGFNVIRLPIAWSYLEPAPNQFDDTYLTEQVDRVVDFAARHGIAVVIEMHQFNWGRCFSNGNGAPAWACEGRGYSNDVFGVIRASCEFLQGATAPDGRTLKDHFADVWQRVGRHYAGDPRVAGFDFFNEPHTVACPSGTAQENMLLYELYRRLRAAVQAEGADQTFFLGPPVSRNIGFPIFTEPFGPDVVYAPHLYTQTGGAPEIKYDGDASTITRDYATAVREAAEFGGPLWAGEFGGNTDVAGGFRAATELFLRDSLAEQDRRLLGGAVWAYFPSDNTFSVVDAAGTEKGDLVNTLTRPYARRVAGIPTEMRFDVDTKEFVFAFRDDPQRTIPEPTELFVPARHYPGGFAISSSGIADTAYAGDSQVLLVRRDPSTTEHRIRITAP